MKRVYIYSTLCFLLSYAKAGAQQTEQQLTERVSGTATIAAVDDKQIAKRSLAECIQLAIKANPTLLQNELDVKRAEVNLAQAKANRLPDVDASLQHSLTSGRSQDNSTLQYISSNNSTGNFSLGASLPLFRGFRLFNEIRMRADAKTAGKLTFDTQINNLKLDVITAYIQSLTAQDILRQSEMQTEVTREQVRRAESMHKEGAINPGDYFDLKGQLANDVNTIENNRQLLYSSRVKLAALLNMAENQLGELDNIGINETGQRLDEKQLYDMAVDQLPDIKALDYRIKVAERDIKIAKSYYYPSLSLSAGLGSNYSKLGIQGTYWSQMRNNVGKSISLNLSIPIFNHLQVYNNVRLAKLDLQAAKFQKEIQQNVLRS
ncbi:MAG TPA: hypothetical protein DCO90_15575, partial [Sphingobacterium sp.]|nr:hypothetical protein [Sphingobacterium sp.]